MPALRRCLLQLSELENRNLLAAILAVGESDGVVRVIDAANQTDLVTDFSPLDTATSEYTGLLQVALGDLNKDGTDDVFVSAANPVGALGLDASKAGKVFVFDGATLAEGTIPTTPLRVFTPFASTDGPAGTSGSFVNGLNIAVGDVNGDGTVDLIAGTRGGNGLVGGGNREVGRLVAISGAASGDTVIGSIQKPFSSGYEKGVVVAAGDLNGDGTAEIAVTRGGPVAPTNPNKDVRLKAFAFVGSELGEINLTGTAATFAPFMGVSTNGVIERDARVAFVDADGDGHMELAFTALDKVTDPLNPQVRVGLYSVDETTGFATLMSTGPGGSPTSYLVGSKVLDHAITGADLDGNGSVELVLITQATASGIQVIDPVTGDARPGGFDTEVIPGGITISTGTFPDGDTDAPTPPGTPTASNITDTTLDLSWTASTDNEGVTEYTILGRAGNSGTFTEFGTSTTTSAAISGLTADTLYDFVVEARDAAGNVSDRSDIGSATTTSGGSATDDSFESNDDRASAADLGTLTATRTVDGLVLLNDDWFSFTTTDVGVDGTVAIDFSQALGDLDMELYDSNGTLVRASYSTNDTESISLGGLEVGTYFVSIYGFEGATNPDYTLTLTPPTGGGGGTDDGFEENDDVGTAADLGTLTEATHIDGLAMLDAGDWYRFATDGIGRPDNSVAIYFQNTLGNLDLELYDANGTLISSSTGSADGETVSLAGLPAGTYSVRVFGFEADTNPIYSMTILPPSPDDVYEDNDTFGTSFGLGTLTNDLTIDDLAGNDEDFFSFTTAAVGTAVASVRIDFDTALGNLDFELYDSGGTPIGQSVGSSNTETISLDGLPAGTYTVRVFGSGGDTNPTYSLSLTPPTGGGGGGTDDVFEDNDDAGTATNLALATLPTTISLVMNDAADWFQFTTIDTGAAAGGVQIFFDNAQGNLDMRLYDSGGNLLDESAGSSGSEAISLNGLPPGTYFVEVFGAGGATNPSYALTITPPPKAPPASGDHVLYLSTEGYNISRTELLAYAGNDWQNVVNSLDADNNGITIQPFLQNRPDREEVIARIISHLSNDLAQFGIEVRRVGGGAVIGERATTVFMGLSSLSNGLTHVAPVDVGNDNLTDIAFVGNENWGTTADTALALADVALHEAGHTWGLQHVQSGTAPESMGLRYNTPQSAWRTDTAFLDIAYNVRPGDGTGTQNSFQIMAHTFGLAANPFSPNPVGGLGTGSGGFSPNVSQDDGDPCACGLCGSLARRGVAVGETGGRLAPDTGPVCVAVNRSGGEAAIPTRPARGTPRPTPVPDSIGEPDDTYEFGGMAHHVDADDSSPADPIRLRVGSR